MAEEVQNNTKRDMLLERAQKIAKSFDSIKQDPMNLNILMVHIGLLSLTVDEILRELASQVTEESLE